MTGIAPEVNLSEGSGHHQRNFPGRVLDLQNRGLGVLTQDGTSAGRTVMQQQRQMSRSQQSVTCATHVTAVMACILILSRHVTGCATSLPNTPTPACRAAAAGAIFAAVGAGPDDLVLTTAWTACSIVIVPGGATVAASLHRLQSLSIK